MNGEMFIFMKINEFAKAVGVSASLLRYYDERGILSPVEKNLFFGLQILQRRSDRALQKNYAA